ncbi:MAG: polyprenyl synthetase family protein [Bacillota bacterium]
MAQATPKTLQVYPDLPEMTLVEERVKSAMSGNGSLLGKVMDHLILAKGKRLRPALVVLTSRSYPSDRQAVIDVAAAAELIHIASLVHDDIIDNSDIRRGLPSVNAVYGNGASVIAGDFLFARAFSLLTPHARYGVVSVMSEAISRMCEGEMEQMSSKGRLDLTEDEYFGYIEGKTASLLAACCQAGALVSKAPRQFVEAMRKFGLYVGCAFQVVDDILDIIADARETGKPACNDIVQGVVTLPIIYGIRHDTEGATLRRILSDRPIDTNAVKSILCRISAFEFCYRQARGLIEQAKESLCVVADSASRSALSLIAELVVARSIKDIPGCEAPDIHRTSVWHHAPPS